MTKKTTSPEFISLDEAAKMKEGTRITFVPGIQAIYAEALKNICYVKKMNQEPNYLEGKGFKSYKTGELPFLNQVYLFNNAKQIVGAHGAAFANLVFCKKDTKIVEIKPTNRPNFCLLYTSPSPRD